MRSGRGRPYGRAWLPVVEAVVYALPFVPGLAGPERVTAGAGRLAEATLPLPVSAVPLLVVIALALARWWWPPSDRSWFALGGLGLVVGAHLAGVVAGAPLFELAQVTVGVLPVLTLVGVRHGRPGAAVATAVLAVLAAVLDYAWYSTSVLTAGVATPSVPLGPALVAGAVALVPIVIGLVLRGTDARRRSRELARIRADERALVARELHDMVANHVTGIVVAAQAAGLSSEVPPRTGAALSAIEDAGNDALAAMRRMVGVLRADPASGDAERLDVLPTSATDLPGAVRSAVGERTARVAVTPDPAPLLPADVLTTVHRVIVEALTNVRRHSPDATAVEVTVDASPGRPLRVAVTNDGVPRTPSRNADRGGGYGLLGVRERLAALGGEVSTGPDGPGRWALRAVVPLPAADGSVPDHGRPGRVRRAWSPAHP